MQIETVSFEFSGDEGHILIRDAAGEHLAVCGYGIWQSGSELSFYRFPAEAVAGGAWTDENTYAMVARFFETPFYQTYICTFKDEQVTVQGRVNVSFGPTEIPPMVGQA